MGTRTRRQPVIVVSQLPPPTHGSTLMTQVFLDSMERIGVDAKLVDRRFSGTIDEVGARSPGKVFRAFGLWTRLALGIRRHRPEAAVLFLTCRPGSFVVDLICYAILHISRVPVVHYVHTVGYADLASRGRLWKLLLSYVLSRRSRVVTLGPTLAGDLAPWVPREELAFIQNIPVDVPVLESSEPVRQGVLFLSNLIPEKGADTFVDVAAILAKSDPGTKYILAGAEADRQFADQLRGTIRDLGIEDKVVFYGYVGESEKWKLLRSCSVLVFPSRYRFEAQPLTLIEAKYAGIPAVATGIGGIPDLVDATGWLTVVPSGSAEEIAEAVRGAVNESLDMTPASKTVAARGDYDKQWSIVLSKCGRRFKESI